MSEAENQEIVEAAGLAEIEHRREAHVGWAPDYRTDLGVASSALTRASRVEAVDRVKTHVEELEARIHTLTQQAEELRAAVEVALPFLEWAAPQADDYIAVKEVYENLRDTLNAMKGE